jgi:hypothetical protein
MMKLLKSFLGLTTPPRRYTEEEKAAILLAQQARVQPVGPTGQPATGNTTGHTPLNPV